MALATHPASMGGLGIRDQARAAKVAFVVSTIRSLRYATKGIPMDKGPALQLTGPQAKPLASWATSRQPLFTLLHALTQQALPAINAAQPKTKTQHVFSTTHSIVTDVTLERLASRIYKQESSNRMEALIQTAPPYLSIAFPSILSTHTSLPLNYFCRSAEHNRLSDDVFTVLWQRKLRLPLTLKSHTTTCPFCKQQMDPYGDHFFTCKPYNKTRLHNGNRDTVCNVIRPLAVLAQWTSSEHDTDTETTGLLSPPYNTHRPADVGMHVLRAATNPPQDPPIKTVALDVTMTSSPSHPSVPPATETNTLTKVHQEAMKLKLNGKQNVDNSTYFADMNSKGILLLPFTIDPFGGIGHHGHKLLYGRSNSLPPPPSQEWINSLNETATSNYKRLRSQPCNLLMHASHKAPTPTAQQPLRMSPHRWARHALALNISTHLAKHIIKSITQHSKKSTTPKRLPTKFLAGPMTAPTQHPFLDPVPQFLRPL